LPHEPTRLPIETFRGLWDTGASTSAITKHVADKLGLIPTGIVSFTHAGGSSATNTYLVNIILPNNVEIRSLRVCEGILSGQDVLIGMDIIGLGDFSICLKDGKTKFSFQIPSTHDMDFVQEIQKETTTHVSGHDKKVGRNDTCPCGSGKKYKLCHGR
jgi:predicted aspartyl protease